jgi:beta-glucosidase/6-phospho-beta-glucosidase/beta-galactosidase
MRQSPTAKHTDYKKNISGYLKAIENAVDACVARGVKTELVMWHCPGWASESGKSGAWKPRIGEYPEFTKRMAKHFKGRVDAFQLYHEVNLQGMMNEADMNFIINEVFINGGRAIRKVYDAEPKTPVIISTSGTSPCQPCGAREGLKGVGAVAVDDYLQPVDCQ